MKLKDLIVESPSTVISGIMSSDLSNAIKLLKKAGFKASKYQGEYVGITGDNSEAAKKKMDAVLNGKLNDNYYEISESLMEADMRKIFNEVYAAVEKAGKKHSKGAYDGILAAVKLSGRISKQNIEDAVFELSDTEIKKIHKEFIK